MIKGEIVLIGGICCDLITTIVGVFYFGLTEGNGSLSFILLINIIIIMTALITMLNERPKWVDYLFYGVGLFRFVVAMYNITLIWREIN